MVWCLEMHKENKRDVTFDLARALAMFMVIYSHVMFYRPGFELKTMPSYSVNFIMIVAMPLFFMVSGYFSCHLHQYGNWKKLFNRYIAYFWPMAFFALVFMCFSAFVLNRIPVSQIPLKAVKHFLFAGWFFQVLAICDGITFIAFRCGVLWQKIGVCLLGYGVCLVCAERIWYVGRVIPMIPFYWFGLLFLPEIMKNTRLFLVLACLGGGDVDFRDLLLW